MSPTTFGTQLVPRLGIKSLPKERAEAANTNNTNIDTDDGFHERYVYVYVLMLSNSVMIVNEACTLLLQHNITRG